MLASDEVDTGKTMRFGLISFQQTKRLLIDSSVDRTWVLIAWLVDKERVNFVNDVYVALSLKLLAFESVTTLTESAVNLQ